MSALPPPLPRPPSGRRPRRLLPALLAALLAHAVAALLFMLTREPPSPREDPVPARRVGLRSVSEQEWVAARPPMRRDEPEGQVVDVPDGNQKRPPRDARFLAEKDNRVEKETRAPAPPEPSEKVATRPAARSGNQPQAARPPQQGASSGAAPGGAEGAAVPSRERPEPNPEPASPEALALRPEPQDDGRVIGRQEAVERERRARADASTQAERAPDQGSGRESGLKSLLPSPSVLGGSLGGSVGDPFNDHLEDVEEGDATFLNTKHFRYAGFFNRVKRGVSATWRPGELLYGRDPTGSIYGGKDRYTVLEVALDAGGRLTDVSIRRSSGLSFLDREAIASFERAQPFPNPPAGLLKDDQQVRFTFGFFLETGQPRLQIFRQHH